MHGSDDAPSAFVKVSDAQRLSVSLTSQQQKLEPTQAPSTTQHQSLPTTAHILSEEEREALRAAEQVVFL